MTRQGAPSRLGQHRYWPVIAAVMLVCVLLWLPDRAFAQAASSGFTPVPELRAPVTDTIGMLTEVQRESLNKVLKDYEARTGSQIAVLLVSSTAPEAIEQYGIRVADAWGIGRKGIDDGVILIVAKDNPQALRRLRIEAGRGVQGSLTDAQSKRILQDVMAPYFRQNDFYGGLAAGVAAIAALLDKEQFAPPEQRGSAPVAAVDEDNAGITLLPILLFAFFVVLPMLSRGRRRKHLDRGGWGRSAGVILGSAIGSSMGRGGFGGGGFGGGGFGGGGGTFDGGGASGDW